MTSIFSGKTGLRHQFFKQVSANLTSAVGQATSVLLCKFNDAAKLAFIDNTLDKDVALLLVHPDADSTVTTNRLFWIEVPTNRVINYDVAKAPNMEFPPGTKMFVYCLAVPSSGAIRVALWG